MILKSINNEQFGEFCNLEVTTKTSASNSDIQMLYTLRGIATISNEFMILNKTIAIKQVLKANKHVGVLL